MHNFTGRKEETSLLKSVLEHSYSEMIAIMGRRRVGKTYLVNHIFPQKDFYCTGLLNANTEEQLYNFWDKLKEYQTTKRNIPKPANWLEAFLQLKTLLQKKRTKRKKIIFIDELPWMDTPKSKFIDALAHFWNDYALYNNMVILVCGSAASWMINKIIHNRGGLHNRITQRIFLEPFTLQETAAFFNQQKAGYTKQQITELYMALGGIPHYLSQIKIGQSVAQAIDKLCFSKKGALHNEYNELFASLFNNAEGHRKIIKALSSKWKGLSRPDILKLTKLKDGGSFSALLQELEQASFIATSHPFGKKKKETIYRIIDPFILFHQHYIEPAVTNKAFAILSQTQRWQQWCGYAFENICLLHNKQIAKALGIHAIYHETASWVYKGTNSTKGVQIDLVIDRADNIINLCEIKYTNVPFVITKTYAQKLEEQRQIFKQQTGTRKAVFTTLISGNGVAKSPYTGTSIQHLITLEDFL